MSEKLRDTFQLSEKLRDAYYMAGAEFTNMELSKRALFALTFGAVVFDLGPWNEWITGAGSAIVQENLSTANNSIEFATNSLLTAATGATIMTAEQLAVGSLTALSIRHCQGTARIFNKNKSGTDNKGKIKGNAIDTVFWGTSAVITAKNLNEPDRTLSDDLKFVAKGSPLVGAYIFGIVGTASVGINTLEAFGYDNLAKGIEDLAKNQLTYIGIYALIKLFKASKNKILSAKHIQQLEQ